VGAVRDCRRYAGSVPHYKLLLAHDEGKRDTGDLDTGASPRFVGEVLEVDGKAWRVLREEPLFVSRLVLAPIV
jgi:hypothetical protein